MQPTVAYPTTPVPAREDAFVMLARFDTALVVDDSGSMTAHWGATCASVRAASHRPPYISTPSCGPTSHASPPIRPRSRSTSSCSLTASPPNPESVVAAAARCLDRLDAPLHQLGVQFLQIRTDAAATATLRDLDDALAAIHGVRDIVDTTPYSDDAESCSRHSSAASIAGSTGGGRFFSLSTTTTTHILSQILYSSSC
jgi:hypothetical protein